MHPIVCIIARTDSKRFPGKVTAPLVENVCMLGFLVDRLAHASAGVPVCVCTTRKSEDDIVEQIAVSHGAGIYRGEEDDVAMRVLGAAAAAGADTIVRITADNPLTCVDLLETHMRWHEKENLEFSRYVGLPLGMTADVVSVDALARCRATLHPNDSEFFMLGMFSPTEYRCGVLRMAGYDDMSSFSVTVDTPDDLAAIKHLLGNDEHPHMLRTEDILRRLMADSTGMFHISDASTVNMPGNTRLPYGDFRMNMRQRAHAASCQAEV